MNTNDQNINYHMRLILKHQEKLNQITVRKLLKHVFVDKSKRSVQRYVAELERAGYLNRKGAGSCERKFFLTSKVAEVFGGGHEL